MYLVALVFRMAENIFGTIHSVLSVLFVCDSLLERICKLSKRYRCYWHHTNAARLHLLPLFRHNSKAWKPIVLPFDLPFAKFPVIKQTQYRISMNDRRRVYHGSLTGCFSRQDRFHIHAVETFGPIISVLHKRMRQHFSSEVTSLYKPLLKCLMCTGSFFTRTGLACKVLLSTIFFDVRAAMVSTNKVFAPNA